MAVLKLTHHLTGLRRDASDHYTPGSQLDQLVSHMRATTLDALAVVHGAEATNAYGLLGVTLEIGQDETQQQQADESDGSVTAGFLNLKVRVVIPNELAYRPRDPASPIGQFVDAVQGGLLEAFTALPNNGADLATALGFGGATVKFAQCVEFAAHD